MNPPLPSPAQFKRNIALIASPVVALAFTGFPSTIPVANAAVADCTPEAGYNVCKVFDFTGAEETFTVPDRVEKINVKLWGAGGGGIQESYGGASPGGSGAFVRGDLTVTAGTEYKIVVGQGGRVGAERDTTGAGADGAFGGGGAGGIGEADTGGREHPHPGAGGSAGGGYSGIF